MAVAASATYRPWVDARLDAIAADPAAGRAPRDAMLTQFEGIDRWVPRPYREVLIAAVHGGAVSLERLAPATRSRIRPRHAHVPDSHLCCHASSR